MNQSTRSLQKSPLPNPVNPGNPVNPVLLEPCNKRSDQIVK
ncbi:MAG: hypothetical protein [Olavius algarvensis Gamma 1 endosymbiont]|nr:MAG: hypothetical protein [Olavius algarvensis Gamma 1 endosymbiont]